MDFQNWFFRVIMIAIRVPMRLERLLGTVEPSRDCLLVCVFCLRLFHSFYRFFFFSNAGFVLLFLFSLLAFARSDD